jgi:hypothetical protein
MVHTAGGVSWRGRPQQLWAVVSGSGDRRPRWHGGEVRWMGVVWPNCPLLARWGRKDGTTPDGPRHVPAPGSAHRRLGASAVKMRFTGKPVGFAALSREARVSRSWQHTKPDPSPEIPECRNHPAP